MRALIAASVLLLGAAPARAALIFTANMDDAQEVAPNGASNTPATGSVSLQLNGDVDPYYGGFVVTSLSMQMLFSKELNFMNMPGGVDNGGTEIVGNLHIHNAARGVNGPVVWGIFAPDHDVDNDSVLTNNPDGTTFITSEWDLSEGNGTVTLANFTAALLAAGPGQDVPLYLNIHTNHDTGGAIRGQIVAPEPAAALLLGVGLGMLVRRRRAR